MILKFALVLNLAWLDEIRHMVHHHGSELFERKFSPLEGLLQPSSITIRLRRIINLLTASSSKSLNESNGCFCMGRWGCYLSEEWNPSVFFFVGKSRNPSVIFSNQAKNLPLNPGNIWGIAVTSHKIRSGKGEHYNLLIPLDLLPGGWGVHMLSKYKHPNENTLISSLTFKYPSQNVSTLSLSLPLTYIKMWLASEKQKKKQGIR